MRVALAILTLSFAMQARASDEGSWILFTSYNADTSPEIFRMRLDGKGLQQLTHLTPYAAGRPRLSPDGKKIAFVRWPPGGSNVKDKTWYLATMNPDGSGIKPIASGETLDGPAWSPDGRQLAFCAKHPEGEKIRSDLYVIGRDGGPERRLTNGKSRFSSCHEPAWSPKGDTIAFVCDLQISSSNGICLIAPDGSRLRGIANARFIQWVDWSPDAERLIYTCEGSGETTQMIVANKDGGQRKTIATGRRLDNPTWSPDGKKILWSDRVIHVMDADGANLRDVPVFDSLTASFPAWAR